MIWRGDDIMLHVTPQSAGEIAKMTKLDQLDAFIQTLRERRARLAANKETALKLIENIDQVTKTIDAGIEMSLSLKEKLSPAIAHMLDDFEFPHIPQLPSLSLEDKIESGPRPSEVAARAREALLEAGRPMKRGELVKALTARGVKMAGIDKNKKISEPSYGGTQNNS